MPSGYCHCGYVLQGPSQDEIERILAQHRYEQHKGPKPAEPVSVAKPVESDDDKPKTAVTRSPGEAEKAKD